MLPPSRQASPQEHPGFEQKFPSPQQELDHENPRDSTVDLDRDHLPQSGRDSPFDLNEQDERAAAAQENMLQAQAAALHALLDDDDEANPQLDDEEIPLVPLVPTIFIIKPGQLPAQVCVWCPALYEMDIFIPCLLLFHSSLQDISFPAHRFSFPAHSFFIPPCRIFHSLPTAFHSLLTAFFIPCPWLFHSSLQNMGSYHFYK